MRLASASGLLLASFATAQSPSPFSPDPGPLIPDPGGSGLEIPVGYQLTLLFSTSPEIPAARELIVGPGGHLYLTTLTGTPDFPDSPVWRVPMNGDEPVQPPSFEIATTEKVKAHHLAYDPVCDQLWACGTLTNSDEVYRIPGSALGAQSTPTLVTYLFSDPDALLWASPMGIGPRVYVAGQDLLYEIDLTGLGCGTPGSAQVAVQPVDLSLVGESLLDNWSTFEFDDNTQSILGDFVGSAHRTVSISVPGFVAWTAGEDQLWDALVSKRGIRYWTKDDKIVMVDESVDPPTSVALVAGLSAYPRIDQAPGGGLFILDREREEVYHLDRVFDADSLTVSAASGGNVSLNTDADASLAGELYLLLGGVSGATPGFPFGTSTAPLNFDVVSLALLGLVPGEPALPGWLGTLDGNGDATAGLLLPPGLGLAGTTLHFCALGFSTGWVSNATWLNFSS